MNGYFQLEIKNDGTYINVVAPTNGDNRASYQDVTTYLMCLNIGDFDRAGLNQFMKEPEEGEAEENNEEEVKSFKLCPKLDYEPSGVMIIDSSIDQMQGIAKFYPPSVGGKEITESDIKATINLEKIRYGIKEEVIQDYLENPKYNTEYIIAEGEPVVMGENGYIEYFFETQKDLAPTLKEDGTVDYRNLNIITEVNEGDILARLHQAVEGKAGIDIYGKKMLPPKVKREKLSFGNNITLSEDQTEIYSDVVGHVALVQGKVFVSNVYQVPANVDNSTGNIEFSGSVDIKGNVNSGFSVKADGDIVIGGVVEGAELYAKGKIIIAGGVHGMSKAVIKADQSITGKFFENAEVIAGESVNADTIIHSQVSAGLEIRVMGEKGFITGGHIRAGKRVVTKTLGSTMGASTEVEVGVDPTKKKRLKELQDNIKQFETERGKMEPTLTGVGEKVVRKEIELPEDKLAFLKNIALAYKDLKAKMDTAQKEADELQEEIDECDGAFVEVSGFAYPGVKVYIGGCSKTLTDKRASCKIKYDRGDVVISQ
ncbi:MAG: FapA family protein [Eubacterium sp.]|nr:FapA family protein [Eubacterium sp.]